MLRCLVTMRIACLCKLYGVASSYNSTPVTMAGLMAIWVLFVGCHVPAAMNETTWRGVLDWEQLHCQECKYPTLLKFQGRPHDLRCGLPLVHTKYSSSHAAGPLPHGPQPVHVRCFSALDLHVTGRVSSLCT